MITFLKIKLPDCNKHIFNHWELAEPANLIVSEDSHKYKKNKEKTGGGERERPRY